MHRQQGMAECVLLTTIVCCRKQSNQLTLSKSFKPVHHTFMSPYNKLQLVFLTEVCHTIRLHIETMYIIVGSGACIITVQSHDRRSAHD